MSLNRKLMKMFSDETGGVSIYNSYGKTYHTLKYVDWLEKLSTKICKCGDHIELLGPRNYKYENGVYYCTDCMYQ